MPKTSWPPGAIFCRTCGYCLHGLPTNVCPECGHDFDPANPKTFRRRPPRTWPKRLLVWAGVPLLVLAAAYGCFLAWLYVGWKEEAGARGLVVGPRDWTVTRSILPSALSHLLAGECRQWQERLDRLVVFNRRLSSKQVDAIGACRRLRALAIEGVPLTGEDVAALCRCRQLEELFLCGAGLRAGDISPISGLPRLRILGLRDNLELDGAAMPALGKLEELRALYLAGTGITEVGLPHLAGLAHLEELYLHSCPKLTDAAVPELSRLTGLKVLYLVGDRLTPAGIDDLRAALPGCKVYGP